MWEKIDICITDNQCHKHVYVFWDNYPGGGGE